MRRAFPDVDLFLAPAGLAGQPELYEALGLTAEEEGDAYARRWTRLRRQVTTGKASQEALDHERTMALAAWQSAANYYHDGLRIGKTAILTEGLRRMRRKRLEPTGSSGTFTKTDPRSRASRVPGRSVAKNSTEETHETGAGRCELRVQAAEEEGDHPLGSGSVCDRRWMVSDKDLCI